jgi:FKBP-type peptidyl-prolyl cis-trans isomerase SlpA
MSDRKQTIGPGCRVSLHFSISQADGIEVLSTFGEEPFSFTLGDGSLAEGLEKMLLGLSKGTEETFILSGAEIYGEPDDDNLQSVPLEHFSSDIELAEGQVIGFTTTDGEELAGQVVALDEKQALIDFNHPLSRQLIAFRVEILDIA